MQQRYIANIFEFQFELVCMSFYNPSGWFFHLNERRRSSFIWMKEPVFTQKCYTTSYSSVTNHLTKRCMFPHFTSIVNHTDGHKCAVWEQIHSILWSSVLAKKCTHDCNHKNCLMHNDRVCQWICSHFQWMLSFQ